MRVIPRTTHIDPRDDRGITAMITVLLLTGLLGLSALVVDVTIAWQERRHVVTSTDAAALAATADFVAGSNGCSVTAPDYLARNNPQASLTSCEHLPPTAARPGRVTVTAEADVDFVFGPALGFTDTTVGSSTSVSYDTASVVTGGLRPYGLCVDIVSGLGMTPGDGVVYRIYYGKDAQPDACNGNDNVPGNWGVLDFDGGANPTGDIRDWTEFGYPGSVAIGDWVEGDPGAFSNSVRNELQHLVDNVESFGLPVFDTYNDLGGSNAEFQIVNFAAVRLHDFKTTGPQADRYLDIEFLNDVVQGTGGGPADGLGAFVIGICAVDGVDAAVTCT